jgi:serine/threonine protein kinase
MSGAIFRIGSLLCGECGRRYHHPGTLTSCTEERMATGFGSIGRFQVLDTLGNGAHSTILHIRRHADSKQYALKVVPIGGPEDQKFQEQAEHEFRVAQMLDHPNLIKIYTLEIARDWLFRPRKLHLLIEYVNGKTLDLLRVIPMPQLVQIFVQVAAGLVHMHRREVCHADLKPNNILFSRTGEVKIIDFGLAWIKGQNKGRIQGTPEYMAPEQAQRRIANERTDIYNFGATMYRLVTMRLPPSSMPEGEMVLDSKTRAHLLKPVQECNPEAPSELCDLIHRCLAQSAHKRPERVSEIHGALDHLADKLVKSPADHLDQLEW